MQSLQANVKSLLNHNQPAQKPSAIYLSTLPRNLQWILPKAHNAIRRRERTKSQLVLVTHWLKQGYRKLGKTLVDESKLADEDQVFFFSHEELKAFINHESNNLEQVQQWQAIADKRRLALDFQNQLAFDEICYGRPVPHDQTPKNASDSHEIIGRPVSRGIVEGRARVAKDVSEAAAIEAGEILVARITDVGWTPYFNLIAGLVTDVGSAVSHGAVIAREYGLPAIVNTGNGTRQIQTGDLIRLNADIGHVEIIQAAAPASPTPA